MGLDISTTTVGIAIIEASDKITLVHSEFYKPPKEGDIFYRLSTTRDYVMSIFDKFKPDDVAIEDIILFMKGFSGAKTIIPLAVLNRTIGLAIYEKLKKPPVLLNVLKIRRTLNEKKGLPSKEEMPELVAKILDIDFPYIKNKKDKLIVENFDVADGIAVALAWAKLKNQVVEDRPKKRVKIR